MNLCQITLFEIESKNMSNPSLSFLFLKNVASQTRLILVGLTSRILTSNPSIIFLIFLASNSKSE